MQGHGILVLIIQRNPWEHLVDIDRGQFKQKRGALDRCRDVCEAQQVRCMYCHFVHILPVRIKVDGTIKDGFVCRVDLNVHIDKGDHYDRFNREEELQW
jgi:hypothetical protein